MNLVDESGADPGVERRFARAVGLRLVRLAARPGSATRWENARFPGNTAFVVELPAGRLAPGRTAVFVRAIRALETETGAGPATGPAAEVGPAAAAGPATAAGAG